MTPRNPLRPCLSRLLLVLLSAMPGPPARAQDADPDFFLTNGTVRTMAFKGDTLYFGGWFSYVGPRTGSFAVLDPWSQPARRDWPRVEGAIHAIADDGQGGWYIGGSFTRVGGLPRLNLAHVLADRSVAAWSPSTNGTVRTIAVAGGSVLVGGEFSLVSGVTRNSLAAFDLQSGALTSWNPDAGPVGVNPFVHCICVRDTTVHVGGNFTTLGGAARPFLGAVGLLSGVATAWDPSPNSAVYALECTAGTIYVGGSFTNIGGASRTHIAALDPQSGNAMSWDPGASSAVTALAADSGLVFAGSEYASGSFRAIDSVTGSVLAWGGPVAPPVHVISVSGGVVTLGTGAGVEVRRRSDGTQLISPILTNAKVRAVSGSATRLVAGGDFTSIGGQTRSGLAAVDVTTDALLGWDPAVDGSVHALVVRDENVLIGGTFSSVGGEYHPALASVDAATGALTTLLPEATYASVLTMLDAGDTLYIGGGFDSIAGQLRSGLAALDLSSGQLLSWSPEPVGIVRTLALQGGTLYVGGDFTTMAGQTRRHAAAFDVATGALLPWDPDASDVVHCLAPTDTAIYVGGSFASIGSAARMSLAALHPTTGLATSWDPAVIPGQEPFYSLLASDGVLYGGGQVCGVGGVVRCGFVALSTTTGQATDWDPQRFPWGPGWVVAMLRRGDILYLGEDAVPLEAGPLGLRKHFLAPDLTPPSVALLDPVGNTAVNVGATRAVSWSASDDRAVNRLDVELSRSGPAGPWEPVALALPNTGHYDWKVTGPNSTNAYLRITARDHHGNAAYSLGIAPLTIWNGVLGTPEELTTAVTLPPPAPNPVQGRARFTIALPRSMPARLSLLDVQGREVAVLAEGAHTAGRHEYEITEGRLRSGIYFLRLWTPESVRTRRIAVLRN